MNPQDQENINSFHRLYYDKYRCFQKLSFLGVYCVKFPTDLLVYAEILWEKRPDVVIECGTYAGGSALFLATIMDAMEHGHLLTIDINNQKYRPHPRIHYIHGSTTDKDVTDIVGLAIKGRSCMVILDSDHSHYHVARELDRYAPLVTQGQYLIVEDTNLNGHPVYADHGPGPYEAVQAFMETELGKQFTVDRAREKFLLTANPSGFLQRK